MKRLLFIIVISIFLYPQLFFSKIVFADNLIGPKIYDLQIGMAVSDAKQIIEGICKQYNVNCTEFSASAYEPGLFIYNDKNIKGFGSAGYNIEIFYRDNSIIGYTLPFKIFNFENSMNRDTFLQQLSNHYELSLSCNKTNCIENNNNLGYKVDVNIYGNIITVVTVQKTESLQFK